MTLGIGCDALQPPTAPTAAPPPPTPGRHEVTIVGEGVALGGVLFRPQATEAGPAIIVLHGWPPAGTNGAATIEARARRYADDGYVALALSLRGWPPSGGADDCGLRQPADVSDAVRWLRAQPGVAAERIGLVGFSQGGQVALLAAARDATVRARGRVLPRHRRGAVEGHNGERGHPELCICDLRARWSGCAVSAPQWYRNIRSVEWKSHRPLHVGARIAFVAHFLGRRLEYTYEVVEMEIGRRFVTRTAEGPFPMETTYTWEPTPDGGTQMTLRNRGTPTGFSRWVAPFMAIAVRRANRQDLALLKTILEARPDTA